ncbi:MAG TPA: hypothetical protein VFU31_24700 [Candidatus Binatia bacterium]|nr:hypothetical protein [Candidatus Binatia bacterium]
MRRIRPLETLVRAPIEKVRRPPEEYEDYEKELRQYARWWICRGWRLLPDPPGKIAYAYYAQPRGTVWWEHFYADTIEAAMAKVEADMANRLLVRREEL